MTNEELYKTIFTRRSVRKYNMTPLTAQQLKEIKDFADNAKPLIPDIKCEFSFLTDDKVKNILPIKAPHYILIYSEKKEGYLLNAGFMLQQVDLFLSSVNLGSCWLGMAKPSKEVPTLQNGLEFVIMLAFGNTQEKIHRADTSEFKRKGISEITSINGANQLLEAARLAPSASNSQPWYFSGDPNEIIISREKLSLLKAPIYNKMNQIDTGIALCHLWLSIEHQGKTACFDYTNSNTPKGYEFMLKVKVEGDTSC
ncbi:nitroreductase family protein [Ruminiclostridium papyrosolvens]|uniref:Nitroreductase n=1 Tax=Ruminiclostridium papyrosolvens C7 TaxID=1330534 RepID=U4R310_9FIRM|nr:nitroreductase family protein [Ruminiclostridium papyrosolvens]EPR12835.1 nitroreductase [Ruminiclostridium papyrosolvens C7]